jgi:LmbE family N-acetylglucosaminyl deacetylase
VGELFASVPPCVLAVYAHPDDPDVSCGGTLASWARRGAEIHVVVCTNGDKGTVDATVDPTELARQRAGEMASAAELLGVTSHVLGYPDGEVENSPALRRELVGWVRRVRPVLVLCPDPTAVFFGEDYYNHRDHRAVGFAVLDAMAPAAALPHYYPEEGPAHQVETALLSGTLEPTVWVDITSTIDDKASALACHRSQFPDGGQWAVQAVRVRAETEGRGAGVAFAEGFRRLHIGG